MASNRLVEVVAAAAGCGRHLVDGSLEGRGRDGAMLETGDEFGEITADFFSKAAGPFRRLLGGGLGERQTRQDPVEVLADAREEVAGPVGRGFSLKGGLA